jgi:hypothetical protein
MSNMNGGDSETKKAEYGDYDSLDANQQKVLEDLRLDLSSFNEILFEWIRQLSEKSNNQLNSFLVDCRFDSDQNSSVSNRGVGQKETAFEEKRLTRNNSKDGFYLSKSNRIGSSHSLKESNCLVDSPFSPISNMSSIKSMLKTIQKNKYNFGLSNSEESLSTMSNETSFTYLDHEYIESNSNLLNCSQLLEDDMRSNLIVEMQSENVQYKQMICDLKEQLHNAEETFTQLANEIDCHLRKIAVLSKSNEDYSIKLNVKMEENDLLAMEFEELKQQLVHQNEKNLTLNEQLKEYNLKCKLMDNDLSSLNETYEKNRFEIQLLLKQLNEKNVR